MLRLLLLLQLQMVFFCGWALLMSKENDTELHIGTLIPSYTSDRYHLKSAVEFAAETIYKRGLLKGYKLVFHHKDTLGTPDKGVEALIALRNENVKICVIGPLKSEVAIYTARLASVWGTLQVSYSASSPDLLSDTYPRFLSLMPTSYSLNAALIKFMEFFKWNRVALAQDANYKKSVFPPTINALKQKLKHKGVKILTTELVDVTKSDTIKSFVRTLKEKDARIVIALLEDKTLFTVMCEAYREIGIVWFNYYNRAEFSSKSRCNWTELAMITERLFVLDVVNTRNDSRKTISGLTSKEFKTKMKRERNGWEIRSALAFDTTWLLALAVNASIKDAVRMQHVNLSTNDHIGLSTKLRKE
ncbi:gamma-aminobutyric acid type B receptor subunit 1-like [Xenia sp. Carnegie-2017]|uniref:gamma-aminobutyric acid type B receptor subunit 1-like n=1 Tax=Xenia sp. Carnegie-2017 TaxID=2897299 RepID=UPI001F03FFA1|nr:gamma-aminobutyric acid type B receptor subunit 1-like [Xenia sp. Carnegie-2017]XP_046859244.1 gamma-aminobutyric acid type B receptor subunit 1-like [Xenia sp. Carnegie-2017]XP_046859245.1 gamma-aminobutyric acid type B receptor subunit 1-like [Xenia sp. Carnegie-2017]XP_046859246.1 gamma-aminobutyric acid type B receptor subunit 1-like [Xenia sp. Carnegie-2017]